MKKATFVASVELWKRIRSIKFPATKRYVEDGGLIPRGFGYAYLDFDRDAEVYYIFPLNWFVWFWRNRLRYWLLRPPHDVMLRQAYHAGFVQGVQRREAYATKEREKAYIEGWNAGIDALEKRLREKIEGGDKDVSTTK